VSFNAKPVAGSNGTSRGDESQVFPTHAHPDPPNDPDRFVNTVISKGQDCIDLLSEAAADGNQAPTNTAEYVASQSTPSYGGGPLQLTPAGLSTPLTHGLVETLPTNADTLSAWGHLHFVETGLMSTKEALAYIDA
jgi:hypothetical protein